MKKHSHTELDARRDRILEAASAIFLRHGFARTTLGTIAHEARVHRPALYALFPGGKEELFEVVLLHLVESAVERYRKHVPRLSSLHRKLMYCVEQWSMAGYHLTELHPDARDAFDMAYPAVRKMYDVLIAFYAELLDDAVTGSDLRLSADQFARLLVFSLRGVREVACDAASMRRLLTEQVDVFLAALSIARSHRS